MKLEPVTKLDQKNILMSKKLMITSFRQIVTSLSFSQFIANLERSGSHIPEAWSVMLILLLIITFYLTKN